jgi:hypothetical protein
MDDDLAFGAICVVLVVLAVALMVLAGVMHRRQQERWRFAVRGWAKYHGWNADFAPQVDWPERLPGRNRRGMSLVLSGAIDGRPVAVGTGHLPLWSLHAGTLLAYRPGRIRDPAHTPALVAPLARVAGLLGR